MKRCQIAQREKIFSRRIVRISQHKQTANNGRELEKSNTVTTKRPAAKN
jgi:hypothetical protein